MNIDRIYRETAPKLQQYLTSHGCSYATACDIVQETFLKLWQKRDELRDDSRQVNGLIYTIALNCRNGLARKSKHEVLVMENAEGKTLDIEDDDLSDPNEASYENVSSLEDEEENETIKQRLKTSLGRMPIELLEAFALSRLSKLSVKDIASSTGVSESNVKVRVHRAKELMTRVMAGDEDIMTSSKKSRDLKQSLFKAMMMLAAVDGEIAREEMALYKELAKQLNVDSSLWTESVKGMAYIGFLSEMLEPEELVQEFKQAVGTTMKPGEIEVLKQMAQADGDYSQIERDCILALS